MSKQPIGFDYSGISPKHKQLIKDHASAITQHLRHSTASMVDIGRRMIEVKQLLGHACFQAWIAAEFAWSLRSVADYMRLAKRFGNLDCLDNFHASALLALSRKHVPETAVNQAVELARGGQLITGTFASELADRIVLETFSANSNAATSIAATSSADTKISTIKLAQTSARVVERGRPTANIRTLKNSVETIRKNMQHVYEAISESDRKALADDLKELAEQLMHEPIIEADVESSDADTESETVAFSSKQRGTRELASV